MSKMCILTWNRQLLHLVELTELPDQTSFSGILRGFLKIQLLPAKQGIGQQPNRDGNCTIHEFMPIGQLHTLVFWAGMINFTTEDCFPNNYHFSTFL